MHTAAENVLSGRDLPAALRELRELEPPPRGWERVVAAERARVAARRRWLRAFSATGLAAAVAAAAIIFTAGPPLDDEPQNVVGTRERVRPHRPSALTPSYNALVAESARLERLLAGLPSQRPLMTGSTASTIVGLEDRIAFLDEQLTFSTARGLEPPQREALWSERVDLMNALVHVRLVQAR